MPTVTGSPSVKAPNPTPTRSLGGYTSSHCGYRQDLGAQGMILRVEYEVTGDLPLPGRDRSLDVDTGRGS